MKYDQYEIGKNVCFVDENQCEIRGEIVDRKELDDRLLLRIKLDDGTGFYAATLLKQN